VEGKIDMAARRQVTNKLRGQYRRGMKADRGKILDRVVDTTRMGRSTARRMLTGPVLPDPAEQVDGRTLRPRGYSDDARALLEHVWALMGMPCGKYLVVKGVSTTKPSPLLRNSITIRTCADEAPEVPGVIEADTVAHCGPTLIGEFVRTLTMTDIVTGGPRTARSATTPRSGSCRASRSCSSGSRTR